MILEALDIVSGVLLSPTRAFEKIRDKRPITLALIIAISMALVSGLAILPNPPQLAEVMLSLRKGTLSLSATLPIWILFFLAILSLQAVSVHVIALILKGKGSCLGMFCGLCLAYLPGLLIAPLSALRALLASLTGNTFYQVGFGLLCIWIFLLGLTAVRHNYRMTLPRAIVVCTAALVLLVALPAVVAVLAMTRAMT
jgi:hypothetical protein